MVRSLQAGAGNSPEANRRKAGVGKYVNVVPLSRTVPYPWSNSACRSLAASTSGTRCHWYSPGRHGIRCATD